MLRRAKWRLDEMNKCLFPTFDIRHDAAFLISTKQLLSGNL